jgi:hypothetical protein
MRWKIVAITAEAIESIALVCPFLRLVAAITVSSRPRYRIAGLRHLDGYAVLTSGAKATGLKEHKPKPWKNSDFRDVT